MTTAGTRTGRASSPAAPRQARPTASSLLDLRPPTNRTGSSTGTSGPAYTPPRRRSGGRRKGRGETGHPGRGRAQTEGTRSWGGGGGAPESGLHGGRTTAGGEGGGGEGGRLEGLLEKEGERTHLGLKCCFTGGRACALRSCAETTVVWGQGWGRGGGFSARGGGEKCFAARSRAMVCRYWKLKADNVYIPNMWDD